MTRTFIKYRNPRPISPPEARLMTQVYHGSSGEESGSETQEHLERP